MARIDSQRAGDGLTRLCHTSILLHAGAAAACGIAAPRHG
jgi:hypothetical protein